MNRITLILAAWFIAGCASSSEPPRLSSRLELKPNVGEIVRVEGTARYLKIAGPSIAGDDFEIRVYPRTLWGPELDGKKIQVIGRLNDSAHATPPDPSLNPGEYWLGDATWKPAVVTEKK
jgi:hypothetical protein